MKTTLQQRQANTVAGIEENLEINLTNTNKKEVKKTMKNQDVATKVKKNKATNVTPVDLKQVEAQAKKFLGEFSGEFNGIEVEETRIGSYNLKLKSKLLVGVKYLVRNGGTQFFLIVPESLKNFSPKLKGAYAESNWCGEFPLSDNTQKFSPIITSIVEKFKAKPVPVVKVAKVAKKNKPVKKHI